MSGGLENPIELLLVEDNPGDARLTQDAFEQLSMETTIHVATDGTDALEFLSTRHDHETESVPDLILLDLNLPRMGGLEFLEAIRDDSSFASLPVLVVTSSTATEDILESYELAANAYLIKPTDPDEYAAMVDAIAAFWFRHAALPPITS
ncbi:response regulator [Natronorubrum thiooxidans]|uniref:Response regulator receiver domain-containing protein n=1 Tax=Natronorubrum thiooxidans TaxID=308853 RepID=A0A1N7E4X4_9EURY|nr:response regulator [Natronorubrum thiooxidans]SIR83101.1 Response regulator receiver domain-containing protein [Natronorubrum thiooxidans]